MRWTFLLTITVCLFASASHADGPTASELQKRLATGSNSGIGQFTSVTGDVSAATVRTAGAPNSRSLAARLSEKLDIRDYGAACDGITDDTAALQAAQLAGQVLGAAHVGIPAGCALKLASLIYTVNSNAWDWGPGAYVTSGGVQGLLDASRYNMQTWTKSSDYHGNENGLAVFDLFNPSDGAINYQKNGLYVRTFQVDPSRYNDSKTITVMHDAVGIESQTSLIQKNLSGRAWAYHGSCGVEQGSEGQCISGEFEIYNNAGYEPLSGRYDSKIGLHVTAMGTQDSSVAIAIAGVQHWETGLLLLQQSLRSDGMAWELVAPDGVTPIASMGYDGTISSTGRFVSSNGQELVPAHPGIAVGRFYYGVSPGGSGTSLSNMARQIEWAPFRNPALTRYMKIGANVTNAVAGSTCFLNVYASKDGVPTSSALLTPTPVIQSGTAGDAEAGVNITLPGGLYFIGITCSNNAVAISTYTENDAISLMGSSSSSGDDTTLLSPYAGSFGTSPVITYVANSNQMVKIWMRR